ncbi:GNAT family N-acetyltransferase [Curtobacterium sp. C2H10]|uniref:GNAT family N-acetyltransferase n=1 Tax=Curtobacterium sp. C2H10 TaxID=2736664 RepID=UPI0021C08C13|nr:GNAT family N-acetyltransferase [Curtobacterium sp. C2H10]MCT9620070.1 GNAT family N-acetyltransferase [Curtobacterium sp. C2H10]
MTTSTPTPLGAITCLPANEAAWTDLELVFGERGDPAHCWCRWFKASAAEFRAMPNDERRERFHRETGCGDPAARTTTGVVAYRDGEPVGWVAVEPRPGLVRLRGAKVPWSGRDEDPDDPAVWVVSCFVVRRGFRRQGVSRALLGGAVDHARRSGATAVEGYPTEPAPGATDGGGAMFVGPRSVFEAAGFTEVSHPTPRRWVYRKDC